MLLCITFYIRPRMSTQPCLLQNEYLLLKRIQKIAENRRTLIFFFLFVSICHRHLTLVSIVCMSVSFGFAEFRNLCERSVCARPMFVLFAMQKNNNNNRCTSGRSFATSERKRVRQCECEWASIKRSISWIE